jgi:hypothetical protein
MCSNVVEIPGGLPGGSAILCDRFARVRALSLLAMATLTSCAVYGDSLVSSDLDGEPAGSEEVPFPGEDGPASSAGGSGSGSGGDLGSDAANVTDDVVTAPGDDATVSMNDDGSNGTGGAPASDAALDAASSPQPILHYKFDETSGDVVNDSSGNARTGSAIGTHTWVAGRVGNALAFDGTSAFVVLPVGIISTLNEMTIATWVEVDATRTWQRIVDFGNNTTVYIFLTPNSNTNKIQLAITKNSNPGQQLLNGTTVLPLSMWKHVAVVMDGQKASLYVDGSLESTSTVTMRPSDLGTTGANWLGRSQYAQDPYFKGSLDDFRIYDRALTAEQISAIAKP